MKAIALALSTGFALGFGCSAPSAPSPDGGPSESVEGSGFPVTPSPSEPAFPRVVPNTPDFGVQDASDTLDSTDTGTDTVQKSVDVDTNTPDGPDSSPPDIRLPDTPLPDSEETVEDAQEDAVPPIDIPPPDASADGTPDTFETVDVEEDTALLQEGDCCENNGTPGCEDFVCAVVVCALDSYCCELTWDSLCVACANGGIGFNNLDCSGVEAVCGCASDEPPPRAHAL